MRTLDRVRLRFRSLFRRQSVDLALEAELRFHLDQLIEENLASGMAPAEARLAALRTIGGIAQIQEECRDMRRVNVIENLVQDLRYGIRTLLKSPGFTAIAVLSLALGIGANTAIFSVFHAVALRLLPVERPGELVEFHRGDPGQDKPGGGFSYPLFKQLQDESRTLAGVAAVSLTPLHARIGNDESAGEGAYASGNFFALLGVRPAAGRMFQEADGAAPLAVISYGFWQRVYGGDLAAVGKTLTVEGKPFTIVGVSAAGFTGVRPGTPQDFEAPIAAEPYLRTQSWLPRPGFNWIAIIGRLRTGVSVERAEADLGIVFKRHLAATSGMMRDSFNRQRYLSQILTLTGGGRGLSHLRNQYAKPLYVLMAVVGAVLLLACINLANLLLARAASRRREFGVRAALGAGRWRLVSQIMMEALLLAGAGGLLGILFARWTSALLLSFLPDVRLDAGIDGSVLAFTAAICAGACLLFGFGPAIRAAGVQPSPSLRESRSSGPDGNLRAVFMVSQVALSLILVAGATLFSRSLYNLETLDPGFQRERVLLVDVNPGNAGYKDARLITFYEQFLDRLRETPGIRAAGFSTNTPISGYRWDLSASVEGYAGRPGEDQTTFLNAVSPGYLAAMGTQLLAGRDFSERDSGPEAPRVLLINESMARHYFAGGSPLGKRVTLGDRPPAEIVGVVADAKYDSLRETAHQTAYLNCLQDATPHGGLTLEVQAARGVDEAAAGVRAAIASVDKNVPLGTFTPLATQVKRSLLQDQLMATLSGLFGSLALLMACVGVYGVLVYRVARRTTEIGIRMALGSQRSGVLLLVLRETLTLVGIGLAVGVPASIALSRYAASLLFGLKPNDPWALSAAVALLLAVAGVAAWLPARRASRVDPMAALRFE
jgi:predicted permease